MAVVTITMKFETSDKVVELLNQLNDRNIDVDVDVDVERQPLVWRVRQAGIPAAISDLLVAFAPQMRVYADESETTKANFCQTSPVEFIPDSVVQKTSKPCFLIGFLL